MAIDTKPNLSNEKFEQYSGETLNLSGCTEIYGVMKIMTAGSFCMEQNAGAGRAIISDAYGKGTWQDIITSTASGERITKAISQTSHGFAIGDVLGWSGTTYNKAIFQPNKENKRAITTASLKGAEIKYEKVTPKGILACKNPKKSGIALQEQKGVITPNIAAKTCPTNLFFPLI